MKLEIPIIVVFDDLESLLDDLKKLQTYKLFEGDEMVLVDIEDVAKVLMDHVKAKKSVKGDMISRRDVHDALECMRFASDEERRYGFSLLEQIPTAQPEVETQMSLADCISRQDALDAIDRITRTDNWQAAVSMALLDLPSAQPERPEQPESAREYCAECDHIEMCRWYPYEGCEFRSLPSVQSKTGKWITVHGYCTPGGDPVWACSECGKGIHVYGIEHGSYGRDVSDGQWKACPNCGAKMEGEEHD